MARESPTQHDTARTTPASGADRLLRAGWEVLDGLSLSRSMAGATTASVARQAGVTTGSFFHHFANAADFADGLARAYLEDDPPVPDSLQDLIAALDEQVLADLIRDSMVTTWRRAIDEPEVAADFRGEMFLWARHREELCDPGDDYGTVADILRQRYRTREDAVAVIWSEMYHLVGRAPIEPFTLDRLATAFTALFQGLVLRHAVEPEAVDDDLFPDLVSVLVSSLSQPQGADHRMADLVAPFAIVHGDTPQARSGARRRRETMVRILDASAGLFADGWESITASEIAERAGVSVQTVLNQFHSVRAVAASTFAVHVPGVIEAAEMARTGDAGSGGILHAMLVALAEGAAEDPACARALLAERSATALQRGNHRGRFDIRLEVPLDDAVLGGLDGLDLGDAEPADLSVTLVDFVLGHAMIRAGRAAETADLALSLVGARPAGRAPGGRADKAIAKPVG